MAQRLARFVPVPFVLAIAIALPIALVRPASVAASAESSMAGSILTLLNQDRATSGLVPLRTDGRLTGLAVNRAGWMAANGDLSRDSWGGAIFDAVELVGVSAWSSAEAVASTNATLGPDAAAYLYNLWRGSPQHWGFLMSSTFNYIGVGVAYRAATGESYASLVFAEAPDSSAPVVAMTGAGRSGRTVFFTWSGRDAQLQTHTAGLRDFDVQYRVDQGAWSTIRTHTTTTQLILANRPAGHTYSVRVRDRDRRNNLSGWSSIRTVRV